MGTYGDIRAFLFALAVPQTLPLTSCTSRHCISDLVILVFTGV